MFTSMRAWFSKWLSTGDEGVMIVEYAIMLVLVAVAAIVANPAILTNFTTLFSGISSFLLAGAAGLS